MSVFIFILVLAALIFVHELGHFIAAKLTGMKVEEFSIGFKPAIYQKKIGETNYVLGLLPIGGYVKILGENMDENLADLSEEDRKRTFSSRPKLAQILVLSMGVVFNILFAWIVLSVSFMFGRLVVSDNLPEKYIEKKEVVVYSVLKDFPAEKAGLKINDKILEVSSTGEKLVGVKAEKYRKFLAEHSENLNFKIKRGEKIENLKIERLKERDGKKIAGLIFADVNFAKIPFFQAFYYGAIDSWWKLKMIGIGMVDFFREIFTAKANLDSVSGPVGIVKYVGEAAQNGFIALLIFTAMLSLNLAVINFLPIPALDGGRVLFVLFEMISRRKIPEKAFLWVNGIGFLFLIGLMIIITVNDVWKIFH